MCVLVVFPVLEPYTNVITLCAPRLAFHLVSVWVSSAPVCMLPSLCYSPRLSLTQFTYLFSSPDDK